MKKISRNVLCIAIIIAIWGCVTSCKNARYCMSDICGVYEAKENIYWHLMCYHISINPDSTYSFRYQYDMADLVSDGNWWIEGRKVILKSFIQSTDTFPVDIYHVEAAHEDTEVVLICDHFAYKDNYMFFTIDGDTVAINSDTISFRYKYLPATINIYIEAKKIANLLSSAKSDDIIIEKSGVYRINTKGYFLQERPLDYLELDRREFRIQKDCIRDIDATNFTLKKQHP